MQIAEIERDEGGGKRTGVAESVLPAMAISSGRTTQSPLRGSGRGTTIQRSGQTWWPALTQVPPGRKSGYGRTPPPRLGDDDSREGVSRATTQHALLPGGPGFPDQRCPSPGEKCGLGRRQPPPRRNSSRGGGLQHRCEWHESDWGGSPAQLPPSHYSVLSRAPPFRIE